MLRLQNQQNKTTKVQIVQVNETKNKANKENDLQEIENVMGKNQFLSWVGVENCVKDKVTGNYAIQMMGIDAMETKQTQPKMNHYKYMKQKVKSTKPKEGRKQNISRFSSNMGQRRGHKRKVNDANQCPKTLQEIHG